MYSLHALIRAIVTVFLASKLPSCVAVGAAAAAPRAIYISGSEFVERSTGQQIVMGGPNVVVKGPPYMPSVTGNTICNDMVNDECQAAGTCRSCSTFNEADVAHIKSRGWNFIRLGVVWAGAQPRDEDALDPDFLRRLHAVLNLTDRTGIHVMLDNHGDMVGSLGCGNGVPAWYQKKAPGVAELLGKPLSTDLPYSLVPSLDVKKTGGYDHCGSDASKWAAHAGDPNYNLLNPCCQAMNSGNPGGLGFTTISQKTMDYVVKEGPGRADFVRYWRLMAEAVKDHPSAFAFELMNEPMSLLRDSYMDTWRACADAIHDVIPDASVAICDIGETSLLPAWVTDLTGGNFFINKTTLSWIESGKANVFYAWHYGPADQAVKNMAEVSRKYGIPTFGTELGCDQFEAAKHNNISHSYWHYSSYCNTGPAFGNRSVPDDTFGACILGWASGNSSKCP